MILIILILAIQTKQINLKEKYSLFTDEERKLIDAKIYPEFFLTSEGYQEFCQNLKNLYESHKEMVDNYYFSWVTVGSMLINPCQYDYKTCTKTTDITQLIDNPIVGKGRNPIIYKRTKSWLHSNLDNSSMNVQKSLC